MARHKQGGGVYSSRFEPVDRRLHFVVVEHFVSGADVWRLVPLTPIVPTCPATKNTIAEHEEVWQGTKYTVWETPGEWYRCAPWRPSKINVLPVLVLGVRIIAEMTRKNSYLFVVEWSDTCKNDNNKKRTEKKTQQIDFRVQQHSERNRKQISSCCFTGPCV